MFEKYIRKIYEKYVEKDFEKMNVHVQLWNKIWPIIKKQYAQNHLWQI